MDIDGGTISFASLFETGSIERGLKTTEELVKNFAALTVSSGENIDEEYNKISYAIDDSFKKLNKSANDTQKNIDLLKEKYQELHNSISNPLKISNETHDAQQTVKRQIVEQEDELQKINKAIDELENSYQLLDNIKDKLMGNPVNADKIIDANGIKLILSDVSGQFEVLTTRVKTKSGDIEEAYQKTAKAIDDGLAQIGNGININIKSIETLKAKYEELGKAASAAFMSGDDKQYSQLTQQQKEIEGQIDKHQKLVSELTNADQALVKLNSDVEAHKAKLEAASQTQVKFRTELMNVKQQMMELDAIRQKNGSLTEEQAKEFARLTAEAERLQTAMNAVNNQVKVLSSTKGSALQGIVSGLSGIAGAASVAQGAVGLFSDKNEELQKIMLKVQSLMAISIGLQQVKSTLDKSSAFSVGVLSKVQNAYTASMAASRAAALAGTGANVGLAASFRAVGAAIKAIPVFGWIIAGISALIGVYEIFSSVSAKRAKQAQEEFNGTLRETSKAIAQIDKDADFDVRIAEASGKSVEEINKIRLAAVRAKIALAELAGDQLYALGDKATKEQRDEVQKMYDDAYKAEKKYFDDVTVLEEKNRQIKEGSIEKQKQKISELQKEYDKATSDSARNKLAGQIKKQQDKLSKMDLLKDNKSNNYDKKNDSRLKAEKAFAESMLDIQKYINDKRIELMQDGIKKEKELIENGYQYELRSIAKLRDKTIEEYNKKNNLKGNKAVTAENYGKVMPDLATGVNDATDAAMANRVNKLAKLNEQAIKEVQKVIDETDEIFKSQLEIQTAQIAKAYEDRKKTIIEKVEDVEEQKRLLASLDEKKEKETAITSIDIALQSLDIKKQIEIEKQKLINKTYLFEADKAAALLKIERDFNEQRLKFLQKQKKLGVKGLEDEIELLKLKIAEMNAELEKMPVEKLQEMLTGLQKITGALGKIGGEAGEAFQAIGGAVDSISASFELLKKNSLSTSDYIGQASSVISGIVDIINMVSAASAKRKQVEKEFYQNQIALAHEYALALNEQLRIQSEISGSGFVTDYAGKIDDGFKALTDATNKYQEALGKLSEGKAKIDLRNAIDWGNAGKGAATGAAIGIGGAVLAGAVMGSVVPVLGTVIGAAAGLIVGGLIGIFGGKKKENVFGGLTEVFPELVDGAGNLNKELAQTLINTNQVDDKTKQLIQNALDWADAIEEANKQLKDIVVDLAGDLGNSMRKSIVDAWKAGEDASKNMFEAASKSLEGFVENMLYSAIFSDVFKKFQQDLVDSLNPLSGDQDIVDDYERLMDNMNRLDDVYIALLDSVKKRASEKGFNMWDVEDTQSKDNSLKGAVKGITQETAGLIAGQFGVMRVDGAASRVALEAIRDYQVIANAQVKQIADQMNYMKDIHVRGWEEVRMIKELSMRVADNSDRIRDLSASISDNTKRSAGVLESVSAGNKLRVEIKNV